MRPGVSKSRITHPYCYYCCLFVVGCRFADNSLSSEGHDVRDDAEGGSGGIDVCVADHKLLENIVLDRASEALKLDALTKNQTGKNQASAV